MKKLLSILGTVGLTVTGASGVVAYKKENKEEKEKPIPEEKSTQTNLIEEIKYEKSRKMKYFNELNSIIQKNKTELLKIIQILENENKDLEQQQSYIKKEINKIAQEIEQLVKQVGSTGSEAVELAFKKQIKIGENNKNNKILELIIKQIAKNEKEIQQLMMKQKQEKFYISEINSISSPTKIIVPIIQQNKNKIYVLEKDIKKIVLNQVKEKVNNNLTEYDFIIEFESKYINHTGTVAIELSNPEKIKIKIHGINNLVGETNWISISLPAATVE